MYLKDVVGQVELKNELRNTFAQNRLPHASLFVGKGYGNLSLALALASFIHCENPTETDACGKCSSCIKHEKLIHPDLQFSFPVNTNSKVKKDPQSALFLEEWRSFILQNKGYVDLEDWVNFLELENKQLIINRLESNQIIKNLHFKPYEAECKILILWCPELLNLSAANNLLKLIEEPPANSFVWFVSDNPENILITIKSRLQTIGLKRPTLKEITQTLGADENAEKIALLSEFNLNTALKIHHGIIESKDYFEEFLEWMRLCFTISQNENIVNLAPWVDKSAALNRENQKNFLKASIGFIRKCLLMDYVDESFVALTDEQKQALKKLAPFLHNGNVIEIIDLLNQAVEQVSRNAYSKVLFMNLSLQIMKLIRAKEIPTAT